MEMKYVPTTCPYCGTGCGFNLVVKDKKVVGVAPWHRNPVNDGKLCPKGNYAAEFINSPDRLTKPLIKKEGKFVEAELGRGIQADCREVQDVPGRTERLPCVCTGIQRRELLNAEVCAGCFKDTEHRPLCPSLPCIDGRRSGRSVWVRCNDPVDSRYSGFEVSVDYRQQHV